MSLLNRLVYNKVEKSADLFNSLIWTVQLIYKDLQTNKYIYID